MRTVKVNTQEGKQLLEALATPAGSIIAMWLEQCQQDQQAEMIDATDTVFVFRAQGAAKELQQIVAFARKAGDIIHSRT